MTLLPATIDHDRYWAEIHSQPLAFWQPALDQIVARHGLAQAGWQRARLGRNVVLLGSRTVIKLGPPFWVGDIAREATALRFVAPRLPIATPEVIATGELDGWEYLIAARLPGINLWQLWNDLPAPARYDLAAQHGGLMAALRAIPLDAAPAALREFNWQRMVAEQAEACVAGLRASGVHTALVDQAAAYLAPALPTLADEQPAVLLHGDLTHLNFLVQQHAGRWRITGVIDWGDIKIGPRTHEFISPGVHMYQGDRAALTAWYDGYGLAAAERTAALEQRIMARALLYYADEFAGYLRIVPGASTAADWPTIARCFWHLSA